MFEANQPKFSDALPAVLLCYGTAFNIAYATIDILWNNLFFFSMVVLWLLFIPYLALVVAAAVRVRRQPKLAVAAIFCLVCTALANFYDPEWFRAKSILEAKLIDDLSHIELIVRADNSCTTHSFNMLGFSSSYHGRCELRGDLLLFLEPPYPHEFLPDSAMIVRDIIALQITEKGEPDLSFASFFTITYRR